MRKRKVEKEVGVPYISYAQKCRIVAINKVQDRMHTLYNTCSAITELFKCQNLNGIGRVRVSLIAPLSTDYRKLWLHALTLFFCKSEEVK